MATDARGGTAAVPLLAKLSARSKRTRGRRYLRWLKHEQGTAVVVVTHDHRSLDVFDAIYQMEDGRWSSSS